MHHRLYVILSIAVVAPLTTVAQVLPPGPAGPRSGPTFEIRVVLSTPADLDALTRSGYNIGSVDEATAVVYVSAEELLWLQADGFTLAEVKSHPSEPFAKTGAKGLGVYHTYAGLTGELQAYASAYPEICRLSSLGKTAQNRDIWAMLITDNPDEDEFEPELRYISTMHGDEPVGTEMCLYFIDHLLSKYGTNKRVTRLVNRTAIWIVPLMNPDGYHAGTRWNSSGIDLNRNFPTWPEDFAGTLFDGAPLDTEGRQLEVQHIINWSAANSFTLAANFHTGALLVNYPYDDDDKGSGNYAASPDDELFRDISLRYAMPNTPMYTNSVPSFPNGIVNGSTWYEITGGMQDWSYRYLGCNEVTIELSSTKIPNENMLAGFWSDNRDSMLSFAEAADIGARGFVRDKATGQPLYAEVKVVGNARTVFTDPDLGDYHRMLLPGTYTLKFSAPGYKSKRVRDVVVGNGRATKVNVNLKPLEVKTDVNGDGKTNSVDLQLVTLALLGTQPSLKADVNESGVVDATDLQYVVNVICGR